MKQGVALKFLMEISNQFTKIGIIYGIASVYNPISIALFKKLKCKTIFEGFSPYHKVLPYEILRIDFPHVHHYNL